MRECFILTFFLDKENIFVDGDKRKIFEVLNLKEGKNYISDHCFQLFANKEILFHMYEYDGIDFIQYDVCLEDLVFTKRNLEEKTSHLFQIAEACISQIDSLLFVTGIYELVSYYIGEITTSASLDETVLSKFPFMFFRAGDERGFQPTYIRNNISCVLNIGGDVQDIFANPITEMMEDEGMDPEEAHMKLYGYDFVEEYAKRFDMSLEEARKVLLPTNQQK